MGVVIVIVSHCATMHLLITWSYYVFCFLNVVLAFVTLLTWITSNCSDCFTPEFMNTEWIARR